MILLVSCQATHFEEFQISIHKVPDLVEEIISPEATDLCSQLGEDVQEMVDQLSRQGQRLLDLKEKKQSDPSKFIDQPTRCLTPVARQFLRPR